MSNFQRIEGSYTKMIGRVYEANFKQLVEKWADTLYVEPECKSPDETWEEFALSYGFARKIEDDYFFLTRFSDFDFIEGTSIVKDEDSLHFCTVFYNGCTTWNEEVEEKLK